MLTYICLQSQDSKINVGLPKVGDYPGLWHQFLLHTNNKTSNRKCQIWRCTSTIPEHGRLKEEIRNAMPSSTWLIQS